MLIEERDLYHIWERINNMGYFDSTIDEYAFYEIIELTMNELGVDVEFNF